jgi:hypothetical protein
MCFLRGDRLELQSFGKCAWLSAVLEWSAACAALLRGGTVYISVKGVHNPSSIAKKTANYLRFPTDAHGFFYKILFYLQFLLHGTNRLMNYMTVAVVPNEIDK